MFSKLALHKGLFMNLPTKIALVAIALAILIPVVLHFLKSRQGGVSIRYDDAQYDPRTPITGAIVLRVPKPTDVARVEVHFRLVERIRNRDEGQPPSAIRLERQVVLLDETRRIEGVDTTFPFTLTLPDDPGTAHATRGATPNMMQLDYDWFCVGLVTLRNGTVLTDLQRIPLVQQ